MSVRPVPGVPRPEREPVSLIVCSRNRPALLRRAVESLLAGSLVPDEIVIVDQSETPALDVAALESDSRSTVRYCWTREIGLSRANNAGVARASHDILVFTHDDFLVDETWCRALVRALAAEGPSAVVTGRVLAGTPTTPDGFAPSLKTDGTPARFQGRIGRDVLYYPLALRRSLLETVGPFDERLGPGTAFPAAEDNDYGFRLLEAGYRIVYVPDAVVYHVPWRRRGEFLALRYAYGSGQGAYYAKYFTLRDPWSLGWLGSDVVRHAWYGLLDLLHGHLPTTHVAYVAGMLSGAAGWMREGRRAQPYGPAGA